MNRVTTLLLPASPFPPTTDLFRAPGFLFDNIGQGGEAHVTPCAILQRPAAEVAPAESSRFIVNAMGAMRDFPPEILARESVLALDNGAMLKMTRLWNSEKPGISALRVSLLGWNGEARSGAFRDFSNAFRKLCIKHGLIQPPGDPNDWTHEHDYFRSELHKLRSTRNLTLRMQKLIADILDEHSRRDNPQRRGIMREAECTPAQAGKRLALNFIIHEEKLGYANYGDEQIRADFWTRTGGSLFHYFHIPLAAFSDISAAVGGITLYAKGEGRAIVEVPLDKREAFASKLAEMDINAKGTGDEGKSEMFLEGLADDDENEFVDAFINAHRGFFSPEPRADEEGRNLTVSEDYKGEGYTQFVPVAPIQRFEELLSPFRGLMPLKLSQVFAGL